MIDKIITLSLGGVDHTLDFGTFWFTKHSQRLLKQSDLTDADKLEIYIISALKAHCNKERKKEDFTTEDVQNWLGDKNNKEMVEIENKIVEILLSDVPGEAAAPDSGA